jgi:hypothetical protein
LTCCMDMDMQQGQESKKPLWSHFDQTKPINFASAVEKWFYVPLIMVSLLS